MTHKETLGAQNVNIHLVAPRSQVTCESNNSCAEFPETLQVFRYQYVDNPYFQVTLCDYSCLTERSRQVKFAGLLHANNKFGSFQFLVHMTLWSQGHMTSKK